ncbi:MAG: hypothetical protein ABFS34_06620 [Gemmatimonadota bacterium]
MEQKERRVLIELTEEQRKRLKEQVGTDAKAIELTAEELEERIAPWGGGMGGGV